MRELTLPVERRLYVVRHAECANVSAQGHLSSHCDLPLTARGARQARLVGERLAHVAGPVVHSSDLPRARETAQAIAGAARSVVQHAGLREISMGELDGRRADEILSAVPGWLHDPGVALPSGETPEQVAERAAGAVADILCGDDAREVVVVAHGLWNRVLIGRLLGLAPRSALRLRQDWACVNVLDRADGRWWVRALNWTPLGLKERAYARAGALPDAEWERLGRGERRRGART